MDHVHLSLSSIIILSFFLTILPPSYCVGDEQPFVVCNRPYNCGSLINIPYPFWGDSRPEYCGHRGYNLSCRNNDYPVLEFEALEFRVLNIDKSTRNFTIARLDLWDGPCPPPLEFHNTTLNFTLFDYASTTVQNITLLYDCPPQVSILAAPNRFNCSQSGVSDGKINTYIVDDEHPLGNLQQLVQECKHNIKVPILRTSARALLEDHQGGTLEVVLQQAMNQGFDVEDHNELASPCRPCEESGGVCGSNATQPFVCYCSDDQVQSYTSCPMSGMHALFSSHFLGLGFLPVLFFVHALSYRPHSGIINFFLIWHSEQLINNRLP
jgi:hypothetical protein